MTIDKFFGISFGHAKLKPFDLSDFQSLMLWYLMKSILYSKYHLEDKAFVEQNNYSNR